MMFQCVSDDGGSGIRNGIGDLGRIPQNGAWLGFYLGLIQWVSSTLTIGTSFETTGSLVAASL
jgi:hypothetical protein